ncbi:MAG: biofilm PGA synthesis N-glycosyltransferase PgaC [Vicingaceae bacterium]|jgi:biofilm PGA synthesis N-glycosyltransferase PgaC
MIGFIFLVYSVVLGWLILAKRGNEGNKLNNYKEPISLVVAYRNERDNLTRLINSIEDQLIDKSNLELILVNDHSTDGSLQLIQQLIRKSKLTIKLFNLESNEGKKAAISLGVSNAISDVIICTDADCEPNLKWIKTMVLPFENKEIKMVLGAVKLNGPKGWFHELQEVEFSTLMAMTLLMCRRKRAIMSNGANYAFRKSAFEESDAYAGNWSVNTGDDVFLLHSFKRKFGNKSIAFSESKESVITTKTKENCSSFFEQRIRWASKSKNYRDYDTLKIGAVIFSANLAILVVAIGAAIQLYSIQFFIGCFLFKWVLDLLFLQRLTPHLRPKLIVKWTFLLSIFYPFYSVGIALLSLFYKPQWKGRKI